MGIEIERRFLITESSWQSEVEDSFDCLQGYLSTDPERVVRIRILKDFAFLTIKGKSVNGARPEFEYPIPLKDAHEILRFSQKPLILKTRNIINFQGYKWEVDVFKTQNIGLIIAEVEFKDLQEWQQIPKPPWVGQEITGDMKYSNANLIQNPYITWKQNENKNKS